MALAMADDGYDIAVHYNGSKDAAESLADLIRDKGRQVAIVQADLSKEQATQSLIAQASARLGGPMSLLINNASVFEHDRFDTVTRNSWDRHMETNLRAPFVLMQAFAAQVPTTVTPPDHEPHAQASVVNIIDQRVRRLTPEFTSYTLSKAGLWALTQTLAQALAPHIRVNAIGPGPTLQGPEQSAQDFALQRQATVLERGVEPGDIVQALRYLRDAKTVTGQMVCVDGGQHLAWKTPDLVGLEAGTTG
jgi:NAD(P)-dependent dehydrogenase (short-subunit alcohol dehydrogenase family)